MYVCSGAASIGARGAECPLGSKTIVKNREKEGKNREKERKNRENNREKLEEKSGKGRNREGSFTLPLLTNRAGYATLHMSGYAVRHALRYPAESWHGGRGLAHEVCGYILKRPHLRSKVIQESICLTNALWLPNLVRRTPDQSVVHCWGRRSCRGHLGSSRGQIA